MPDVTIYGTTATAVGSVTWTGNPSAAIGPPDDVGAASSGTSNTNTLDVGFVGSTQMAAIPDGAVIQRVYRGFRWRTTSTTNSWAVQCSAGDTALRTFTATPANVWVDDVVELNPALFTAAILKSASFVIKHRKNSTSSSVQYVDAAWVRVVYDEPYVRSWGTSATASGSDWLNPANAVGFPNNSEATTSNRGVDLTVFTAGLSSLPANAVLTRVTVGIMHRSSTSTALPSVLLPLTTPPVQLGPVAAPTVKALVEKDVPLGQVTVANLKDPNWRVVITSPQTTQSFIDAVHTSVEYTVPGASRARRWTGSAWVDAPPRRWTGSAWQDATVRRFDGSAWV